MHKPHHWIFTPVSGVLVISSNTERRVDFAFFFSYLAVSVINRNFLFGLLVLAKFNLNDFLKMVLLHLRDKCVYLRDKTTINAYFIFANYLLIRKQKYSTTPGEVQTRGNKYFTRGDSIFLFAKMKC